MGGPNNPQTGIHEQSYIDASALVSGYHEYGRPYVLPRIRGHSPPPSLHHFIKTNVTVTPIALALLVLLKEAAQKGIEGIGMQLDSQIG